MKKEAEEARILAKKEEEKKELLKEIVNVELRDMVKELIEEVAPVEREHSQKAKARQRMASTDIEGFFGQWRTLKLPERREGGFKLFSIRPYRKASYDIEDLVIAMYQGLFHQRCDQNHGDTSGAPLHRLMGINNDRRYP